MRRLALVVMVSGCSSDVAFRTVESEPDWDLSVRWESGRDGLLAAAVPLGDGRGSRVMVSLSDDRSESFEAEWRLLSADGEDLGPIAAEGGSDLVVGGLTDDRAAATLADLDGLVVVDADGSAGAPLALAPDTGDPTFPDLARVGGRTEVTRGPRRYDPLTGELLAEVPDARGVRVDRSIVADLDQDGTLEWVVAGRDRAAAGQDDERSHPAWVRLHELDGAPRATCAEGEAGTVDLAIADLGGAPGAELVVMLGEEIVVCGAGGVEERRFPAPADPHQLAVADLDGDGAAEIVVATDEELGIFDAQGSERWRFAPSPPEDDDRDLFLSFTGADLDADGTRELVVQDRERLWILDAVGRRLSEGRMKRDDTWHRAEPVLADVDGDGSAELLLTTKHGLTLVEPVDQSWPIAGPTAIDAWAPRHYAGMRDEEGAPRDAGHPFWAEPGAAWGVR